MLELSRDEMENITRTFEIGNKLNTEFTRLEKLNGAGQRYPLDYMLASDKTNNQRELRLSGIFKNVTMTIISEIKDKRKRPKLSDFIKRYHDNKDQPNAKQEFQKKFKMLYSDAYEEDKDPKFDELILVFDRMQKAIHSQHRALDFLVKKVNKLIERKGKSEKRKRNEGSSHKKQERQPELLTKQTERKPKQEDIVSPALCLQR